MKQPGSATDPLWYKDAVIYELHVRAFADSNGDGIGDFPGLTSKLDYLHDLGVTCLWLLPFFPSPLRDDGYDIADYCNVNPSYGTLADFENFVQQAHARNMQVLIELVMNHSSDQHPWFQRARYARAGSAERDFYVWSDSDQTFPGVRIIFNDTEKSNWTWDPVAKAYYWHRFFSHQPDLNFDNPAVFEEMLNAMRFWFDRGVDGLRLDAIPYLIEREGTSCENLPETHAIIRRMREVMDAEYRDRFLLAEANQWPSDVRPYFGEGDECNMAFHFPLMPRIYVALRQEDRLPIVDIMHQTPEIPAICQWGLFLRNHDELTLEMVTEDERDYMYLAYSAEPRMRLNLGIRRRLAPLLDNNRDRIELLNSLLFSFPGSPILYYGDELGMGDNLELGDRNGVRTPMQWDSGANGGFSTAPADQLYFPIITDTVYGYQAVNVAEQRANPSSLLQWTRNMIGLRKLFSVFGRGTLRFVPCANRKVLAYVRQLGTETVLCIANLSRFAQPAALEVPEFTGCVPMEMFGYNAFPAITERPYVLTLAPYSFLWFELQSHAAAPVAAQDATSAPAMATQATRTMETTQSMRSDARASKETSAEAPAQGHLLLHIRGDSLDGLRQSVAALTQSELAAQAGLQVTVAFPAPPDGAPWAAHAAELAQSLANVQFAPYASTPASLPTAWPYTAAAYAELAQLAEQHQATAVLQLGPQADPLPWHCMMALASPVLRGEAALSVANYELGRFTGLLNSAALRPLIRSLFRADIAYPLAPELALSRELLQHIAAAASASATATAQQDPVRWPVLDAVARSMPIAQVAVGARHFSRPGHTDVAATLTEIMSSLFSEIELRARYWQRNRPLHRAAQVQQCMPAATPYPVDRATVGEEPTAADVAPMLDAFHLGVANLQEVWSQTLAPGTLLAIKRLAAMPAAQFAMADHLWVRIVWDFLAAYRARSVNRNHIFGALVPLYLGWAASHVMQVATLSDAAAAERMAALASQFEADRAYLLARWRWPDRFTP